MAIEPDAKQLVANLTGVARNDPFIAMNLLKYRKEALYPEGSGEPSCTGKEAYGRYGAVAVRTFVSLGGRILVSGAVEGLFIGEIEEGDWDDMVAVWYPSRRAFEAMVADPEYNKAHIHRRAGLDRSIVLFCSASIVP